MERTDAGDESGTEALSRSRHDQWEARSLLFVGSMDTGGTSMEQIFPELVVGGVREVLAKRKALEVIAGWKRAFGQRTGADRNVRPT